jgi:hypothetical protein
MKIDVGQGEMAACVKNKTITAKKAAKAHTFHR